MPVRGINPGYFAGMPTTQRDPRAGQVDPSYAAMPGQALSEANALNQRRSENAEQNAFRAREQSERERSALSSESRDDRRLGMYQQGEDRRQTQQGFENDRVKSADTRKLMEALQSALDAEEYGIAEALATELKSRGHSVAPVTGGQTPPPGAGPPGAPPAPRAPMSASDANTSKQLDQAEAAIMPKLTGKQTSPGDAALSAQLDGIEDKYMTGITGKPRSLVPGRSMRPQVAQSDAMLSEGDPYSRIK